MKTSDPRHVFNQHKACIKIRLSGMRDQGRHGSAPALAVSDLRLHLLHPTVHGLPTEQARLKNFKIIQILF